MNSKYRILALLTCLMLLLTLPGTAEEMEVAPDALMEPVEESIEAMPEAIDAPIELPIIEAEMESPVPSEEAANESAPLLPELTQAPSSIEVDKISGVASGSNYSRGYAKLTSPTTGYSSASPDAEAIIYLESGVFYVSDRRASSASDRLRVHFSDGSNTRSVWVDERSLRPMSAGAVQDFVSSRLSEGNVHLYGGDPMLPLDTPAYSSAITYSKAAQECEPASPAMFVNQPQLTLAVGETLPIGVSFSDGKGHAVSFASEDAAIASVSDDGRVTGVSAGTTHVQLRSEFSNIAVIEIQVQEQ